MTLQEELDNKFKKAGYIDYHFYTKQEWVKRGEMMFLEADLTLTAEGTLNYLLNGYYEPERGDIIFENLADIAEKYGYSLHQGLSWSWHFVSKACV